MTASSHHQKPQSENLNLTELKLIENNDEPIKVVSNSNNTKPNIKSIIKEQLKENVLLVATVVAVVLGISIGFVLRSFFTFNDNQISYFGFIGQLFLRMLKFLILPLIATSLISGIAGLGSNSAGKIAMRALIYYFSTTITAVVIGIILVVIIKPGSGKGADVDQSFKLPIDTNRIVTTHDTLLDLVRNLFPDNIIEMAFREYETNFQPEYKWQIMFPNGTNITKKILPNDFASNLKKKKKKFFKLNPLLKKDKSDIYAVRVFDYYKAVAGSRRSLNVLGVILFCFVFGGVLASMGKEAEIIVKIFEALNNCSVRMIRLVMT